MATNRRYVRRHHRSLNHAEEMTLIYGPDPRWDAFDTAGAARTAWAQHRERILERYRGRRPWAWWRYEAPVPRPRNLEDETPTLYRLGLLGEDELAELKTEWRRQFDKVQSPEWCGHCIGHAKPGDTFATFVDGEPGRRLHYRWAGIPRELSRRWTEERRRRIRNLKKVSPPIETLPTGEGAQS